MATPVPEHLRPLIQTIFPYLNVDNIQVTRGPKGHGYEAYDLQGKGEKRGKGEWICSPIHGRAFLLQSTKPSTSWQDNNALMVVDMQSGYAIMFMHMSNIQIAHIKTGVPVWKGQPLGTLDEIGKASGIHLHMECAYSKDTSKRPETVHYRTYVNEWNSWWLKNVLNNPAYPRTLPQYSGCKITDPYHWFLAAFDGAPLQRRDPLVLDLNNDGIQTTYFKNGQYFDHNGDGFAEQTGWIDPSDGFLVIDRNGDGIINDGSELFGDQTHMPNGMTAANGFHALSFLDENHDGRIDAADSGFTELRVWTDLNGDGYMAQDELGTLYEVGVSSINVESEIDGFVDENGNIRNRVGSFEYTDGSVGDIAEYNLRRDPAFRIVNDQIEVPEDLNAFALLTGYGQVYDLEQAMALDTTGELRSLVEQFMVITEPSERSTLLEQILFKWTDSEDVDPNSRGTFIDARRLAVLEKFFGTRFVQPGGPNTTGFQADWPEYKSSIYLNQSYHSLFELMYSWLMSETHLKELYDAIDYNYNRVTQVRETDISGVVTLIQDALAADYESGKVLLSEFARNLRGYPFDLSQDDYLWLNDYLSLREHFIQQDPELGWIFDTGGLPVFDGVHQGTRTWSRHIEGTDNADAVIGSLTEGDRYINGLNGDDVIYGTSRNEHLINETGNALLVAGGGDDWIWAGADDDILDGGEGNDLLWGEAGNDTYLFRIGSGQDVIIDRDNTVDNVDTIWFGSYLTPDNISVKRSGNHLVFSTIGTTDTLTVRDFFRNDSALYRIERIQFMDGTVWTDSDLLAAAYTPGPGNDIIYGGSSDDIINGLGGNDSIYGIGGNDVLLGDADDDRLYGGSGDDILDGGTGDDILYGGIGSSYRLKDQDTDNGNDTFRFGRESGHDRIVDYDTTPGAVDTLELGPGILPEDILLERIGNDLRLTITDTGDTLTVQDWLEGDSPRYGIEAIRFADGATLDLDAIQDVMVTGTDGDDVLTGFARVDAMQGFVGDDTLYGRGGDDAIDGGTGADTLWGDAGNDTLIGGEGNDKLVGGDGDDVLDGGSGDDVLHGGRSIDRYWQYDMDNGNDTYLFGRGSGHDTVYDWDRSVGNVDTVQFGADIISTDIDVQRIGEHLQFTIIDTGDTLTMERWFWNNDDTYKIERFEFSDGTVWDVNTINQMMLQGTPGDDFLVGFSTPDTIQGYGGNDELYGRAGDDFIEGGSGNDRLYGEAGADTITGGDGDDLLYGGAGADILDGGAGNDALYGSEKYYLPGTSAANGNDIYLFGRGSGQDRIFDADSTSGNVDAIVFDADILPSDIGVEKYLDHLVLSILDTDDTLTVNYWFRGNSTEWQVEEVRFADGTTWDVDTIKQLLLQGTPGDDVLRGYPGPDTLNGFSGNDSLYGEAGDDILDGGADNDYLYGGTGNDTYLFGRDSGRDTIIDQDTTPGNVDTLLLADDVLTTDVTLTRDANNLYVEITGTESRVMFSNWFSEVGGYTVEQIQFHDGTVWDAAYIIANVNTPSGSDDYLVGTAGDDIIDGAGGNDQIYGRAGNDTLYGSSGYDYLYGEEGNDLLDGGDGWDELYGGEGDDTLYGGEGDDYLRDEYGNNTFYGGDGSDYITSGEGDDIVYGGADNDYIYDWEGGNNYFDGGSGNDEIKSSGSDGVDHLVGGSGEDYLVDRSGTNIFEGGTGNDIIDANEGQNTIYFNIGDGWDLIGSRELYTGEVGTDSIIFGTGITPDDLSAKVLFESDYWSGGYYFEELSIDLGDGDGITIDTQWHGGGGDALAAAFVMSQPTEPDYSLPNLAIQRFVFADGTELTLDELLAQASIEVRGYQEGTESDDYLRGSFDSDEIYGYGGNDWIETFGSDDYAYGGIGDDVIQAGGGDDLVVGGTGNDVVVGGTGNDTLGSLGDPGYYDNEPGADVYCFNRGDGQDTIIELGGSPGEFDTISYGVSITPQDITAYFDGNNLILRIEGESDQITHQYLNHLTGEIIEGAVSRVQFIDIAGSAIIYDLAGLVQAHLSDLQAASSSSPYALFTDVPLEYNLTGSVDIAGGDYAIAYAQTGDLFAVPTIIPGSYSDDHVTGTSGSDYVTGLGGDDIIEGGEGNDVLDGGSGNDTYVFNLGDGVDTIIDGRSPGAGNEIVFGTGIAVTDLTLSVDGNTLQIKVGSGGDALYLEGFDPDNPSDTVSVETFRFADGTVFSYADLLDLGFIIEGTPGDDTLTGTTLQDTFIGHEGNDVLFGGDGDDTYRFNVGDGVDTISDTSDVLEPNMIVFGDGITPDDITLTLSLGSLVLNIGTNGDAIHFTDFDADDPNGSHAVEYYQFTVGQNQQIVTYSEIIDKGFDITGTSGDDTLTGTWAKDRIVGGDGDDILAGGAGDDMLSGGAGDDRYIFNKGDGIDKIEDIATIEAGNTLVFGGEITVADMERHLTFNGNTLIIRIGEDGDEVHLSGFDQNAAEDGNRAVQNFEFSDGTILSYEELVRNTFIVQGGSGDDDLTGTYLTDRLYGYEGSDRLSGGLGRDTLTGGIGNDELIGGEESDLYVFHLGDGVDKISDSSIAEEGNMILFGDGITQDDLSFTINGTTLSIEYGTGGDQIQLLDFDYNGQNGSHVIETIEFADGSQVNLVSLLDPGTEGDDVIIGSYFVDNINAKGGNDTVTAFQSNDTIDGGTGDDIIDAGSGDDLITGGTGNDTLTGGEGNDTYVFNLGDGVDTITDTATLQEGNLIQFSAGITQDDVTFTVNGTTLIIEYGTGGDQIQLLNWDYNQQNGSHVVETMVFDDGSSVRIPSFVDPGTEGDDEIIGSYFVDIIDAKGGNDTVSGLNSDDMLYGGSGNDTIAGDGGHDTIEGGTGNDVLTGGYGNDTYVFNLGDGVDTITDIPTVDYGNRIRFGAGITQDDLSFTLDGTTFTIGYGTGGDEIQLLDFDYRGQNGTLGVQYVEFFDGSEAQLMSLWYPGTEGDDFILGSHLDDDINALGGNDTVLAFDSNDIINGGTGNDTIDSGSGDDVITGGQGTDILKGEYGSDTYVFNLGDGVDTILDSADYYDNNVIRFGAGITQGDLSFTLNGTVLTVVYGAGGDQIQVLDFDYTGENGSLSIGTIEFADGSQVQLIDAWYPITEGDDTIYGTYLADEINALGGNDTVLAFGGADTITGSTGNDTLEGGAGYDTYVFNLGDGTDTIVDSAEFYGGNLILFGEGITQDDLSFSLNGTILTIVYGTGGDEIQLLDFDYTGQNGSLVVQTIEFSDSSEVQLMNMLYPATEGDDIIMGSHLDDEISGLGGNDTITAYDGYDTIDGGVGDDTLAGGEGYDTYVFNLGDGVDTISDMATLQDSNLILFGEGITQDDLSFTLDGTTLTIEYGTGGDQIQLLDFDPTGQNGSLVVHEIEFADGATTLLMNSVYASTEGNDTIIGSNLDDELNALGGNDSVEALAGDDVITGGTGNDLLIGGGGNDTYVFNLGDGVDTITDTATLEEGNLIVFGDGITQDDLSFTIDGTTLTIEYGTGGDQIQLLDFDYTGQNGSLVAQTIAFDSGSYEQLINLLYPATEGDDVIVGSYLSDDINALGGNDTIDGGAGDDTIYGDSGDDVITGGIGDDTLVGGEGSDTYIFNLGDGVDYISDEATLPDEGNTIQFGPGITLNDLKLSYESTTLIISVGAGGDALQLDGFDPEDALGPHAVETFRFDDGTEVTYAGLIALGFDLTGTESDDAIPGTNVDDRVQGLAGNDTIETGTGNDLLDGGAGADTLIGGAGDDTYVVDNSGDVVFENVGGGVDAVQSSVNYTLYDNVENLTLTGDAAINGTGNDLNNVLTGNSADNVLDGGAGIDTMSGGAGSDTYLIDNTGDVVIEGSGGGVDTIQSSINYTLGDNVENLTLIGDSATNGVGNDLSNVLTGNSADNVLDGGVGVDTLISGDGNDELIGGLENDELEGGAGDDTYVLNIGDGLDTITDTSGSDTLLFGVGITQNSISVEVEDQVTHVRVLDAQGNDTGEGFDINGTLNGTPVVETVELSDGTRLDIMDFLNVSNIVYGTNRSDFIHTGDTADIIYAKNGNDIVFSGANNDIIYGGNGRDYLNGQSGNDILYGENGRDVLYGGPGDDFLDGGSSWDWLFGGSGNDTYVVDHRCDMIFDYWNGGTDTVQSSISYTLGWDLENLTLTGTKSINGYGNSSDNTLIGNSGNNNLYGYGGNDLFDGGAGNDWLYGGSGSDTYRLYLGSGHDYIQEQSYDLRYGGGGNDWLYGGWGSDPYRSNPGWGNNCIQNQSYDMLCGVGGNDWLYGGSMSDTLHMNQGSGFDSMQEQMNDLWSTDVLEIGSGVSADQIWFRRTGNDLEVSIIGTENKVTITDWYRNSWCIGSEGSIEQFQTDDGKALLNNQVDTLVNAMASFAPPAAGQTTLPDEYQKYLNPIIAASWH